MTRTILMVVATIAIGACDPGKPAGPPQRIRAFTTADVPIAQTGVTPDDGGWRLQPSAAGSVPLYEVPLANLENVTLTYRAEMRATDVTGRAYLEMWVRVPGRGEFFSRGLAQPLQGSSGWATYEIPFLLNESGVRADLAKLNVAFENGTGTVWIKHIELLQASLGGRP